MARDTNPPQDDNQSRDNPVPPKSDHNGGHPETEWDDRYVREDPHKHGDTWGWDDTVTDQGADPKGGA